MSLKNVIPPKKMQTGGQTFQSFIAKQFESQNLRGTPLINQTPFVNPVEEENERTINLPSPIQPIDPIDTITPEQQLKKLQDDISIPGEDLNTIYNPDIYGDSSQAVGIAISNIENISKAEANALSSNTQNALLSRMSPAVVDALATPNKEPFGIINKSLAKVSDIAEKYISKTAVGIAAKGFEKVADRFGVEVEKEEEEKSSLQRTDPAYFGGPIYQRQQAQANEAYVETFSYRDNNGRTISDQLLSEFNTGRISNTDYAYALEAHKNDITNTPGFYEGVMATAGGDEQAKNALGYALGYTFDERGRFSTTPNGMGGQESLDRSFSSRDHARAGVSNQDIINLIHDGKTARGADKKTITTGAFTTDINAQPLNQIEVSGTFDNVTPEEARDIIDDAVKDGATEGELNLAVKNGVAAQNLGKVTGRQAQLNMGASPDIDASPKVICAELYRQGLLEKEIFELDEEFGRHLRKVDPDIINGYHQWALPLVSLMQRSIVASHIIKIIARPVVKHIAYQMGYPSKTYLGHAMFTVGKYICRYKAKKDIVHA